MPRIPPTVEQQATMTSSIEPSKVNMDLIGRQAATKQGQSLQQLRILLALSRQPANHLMNRHVLIEASGVNEQWLIEWIGSAKPKSNFVRGHVKLEPAGLVEAVEIDICGKPERTYRITDAGRLALADPLNEKAMLKITQGTQHEQPC